MKRDTHRKLAQHIRRALSDYDMIDKVVLKVYFRCGGECAREHYELSMRKDGIVGRVAVGGSTL